MATVVSPEVLVEGLDKHSAGAKDHESRQYKRFVWDAILRYVAVLGVTLVVVGLGEEFFLERGLACNTPNYVTRDQYTFVVIWCSRIVRLVDLLPLLILIQSLCIFGPQEVWEIFVSSSLEQFFSLSPRLKRLRDKRTGSYDVDTARVVRHLFEKYKGKHVLYMSYWAKIILQMVFCYTFLILMFALYQGGGKFQRDFVCYQVGSLYSQNVNVNFTSSSERFKPFDADCTYTTAEAFLPVWIINIVLLFAGTIASTIAVIWLLISHWVELDPTGRSEFYYSMGMNIGDYHPQTSHKRMSKIRNDLDFLVMLLFNLDRGQGESFYDVQVELNLQEKWSDDFERYTNYLARLYSGEGSVDARTADEIKSLIEELPSSSLLGKHLFEFIIICAFPESSSENSEPIYKPFERALHLFCGSKGCSIAVARVTREMYAVDFNKYCHLTSSLPDSEDLEAEDRPDTTELGDGNMRTGAGSSRQQEPQVEMPSCEDTELGDQDTTRAVQEYHLESSTDSEVVTQQSGGLSVSEDQELEGGRNALMEAPEEPDNDEESRAGTETSGVRQEVPFVSEEHKENGVILSGQGDSEGTIPDQTPIREQQMSGSENTAQQLPLHAVVQVTPVTNGRSGTELIGSEESAGPLPVDVTVLVSDRISGTGSQTSSSTEEATSIQQMATTSPQQQEDGGANSRQSASIESAQHEGRDARNYPEARSGEKHSRVEIIEEHFGNLVYFRVPFDITSKSGTESKQLTIKLTTRSLSAVEANHPDLGCYDLIVVSCMEPHFRASTARVILDAVFVKCTKDKCLIVFCTLDKEKVTELTKDLDQFCDQCRVPVIADNTEDAVLLEPPLGDIGQQPDNKNGGYLTGTFTCSGQEVSVFFRAVRFDRQKYRRRTRKTVQSN